MLSNKKVGRLLKTWKKKKHLGVQETADTKKKKKNN
jgi:hypothetical protein